MATVTIYLLAGTTSWTVPTDWTPVNTIECIGAGGGGAAIGSAAGGGEYRIITNQALSGTLQVSIGAGGAPGDTVAQEQAPGSPGGNTWFNGTSLSSATLSAGGGQGGTISASPGGAGGTGGIGGTGYPGGQGGTTNSSGPGGGGGAGGPNGAGAIGGAGGVGGNAGGGGGGGNGGGSVGSAASTTTGGSGGNNSLGSGGGLHGVPGAAGADGGGGGGCDYTTPNGIGGAGGNGIEFDASHGSGGGGGGGASMPGLSSYYSQGGAGGNYGGGGGGSSNGFATSQGGQGANGLIRITYSSGASSASLSGNGTLSPHVQQPGEDVVSYFPSIFQTSVQNIVKQYLYVQYNDDENIQSFVDTWNVYAQAYLNYLNSLLLPVYTSDTIVGPLLDWVAVNLYGIVRPTLATGGVAGKGQFNTYQFNTTQFNSGYSPIPPTVTPVSDDTYKRVLTWRLYRGDGRSYSPRWLKRRIARFLWGVNGTDFNVAQTYTISVVYARSVVTITLPTNYETQVFQAVVQAGALDLPFQTGWSVVLT